jgi:hypothetical protein
MPALRMYCLTQGSMMMMRMPPIPDGTDTSTGYLADGMLYFGDGSLRLTAAGIVWLGLLSVCNLAKNAT